MLFFYLIRLSFFLLFSFIFLNSIGVLKIPLDFPWMVMLIPIIFAWWFWEEICRKTLILPKLSGFLLVLVVCVEAVGNAFYFFDRFNWYDKTSHFVGGLTIGLIIYLAILFWDKKYSWKLISNFLIIFSISLALTFLVVWEFYEYFIDLVKDSNMITDKFDTADDLLFGFLGTSVSVLSLAYFLKQRGQTPIP